MTAAELLDGARRGEFPREAEIREFGETHPAEFFRDVVEPLADSFEIRQAAAYERLMRAFIPAGAARAAVAPAIPDRVDIVYVLSRVTLGSDIKIVSPMFDAMKRRFPGAQVVFVANRKSAELFAADPRIGNLEADYPRTGPVSARLKFADDLRGRLEGANAIMIDPDSRMTQLGLIPLGAPERYFHFPSRVAGGEGRANLSDLVGGWLRATFGLGGNAYTAPETVPMACYRPCAAVSFGVGGNDAKRVGGDFEARAIRALSERFRTVWVDRGAGGEEARRVTASVAASSVGSIVRFWEGSFAGFASLITQCDLYVGYDSAGQHAAAAAGVRTISIFAGAPSERFRERWTPAGRGEIVRIDTDGLAPEAAMSRFAAQITYTGTRG